MRDIDLLLADINQQIEAIENENYDCMWDCLDIDNWQNMSETLTKISKLLEEK